MRYLTNQQAQEEFPGCITDVIRRCYIHGEPDEDVFSVVRNGDWVIPKGVPNGSLTFMGHGYNGVVWWEGGRWLYSDFGDVCCHAHHPQGPDHNVYEYLGPSGLGAKVR